MHTYKTPSMHLKKGGMLRAREYRRDWSRIGVRASFQAQGPIAGRAHNQKQRPQRSAVL